MLAVILLTFAAALIAPLFHGRFRRVALVALPSVPLMTLVHALVLAAGESGTGRTTERFLWVSRPAVELAFAADGLSILFAILISGMGFLVMVYAGPYLHGHPHLGRLKAYLLFFMGSMLGLVYADNLILLFIFWELTSISSFLLIGFHHESSESRAAALQALLVTGAGGLALLAGLLLLGGAAGTYDISRILMEEGLRAHPLYPVLLVLILGGAFTKSAQLPFHFWLPSAMAAPTPVSAYLHSATMVKAGVYLLARLHPALGGTDLWFTLVPLAGAVTMLFGSVYAIVQTDLKKILAYTTVAALGTLILLLGLGTEFSFKAAMVFLVVHALYKGALFLIAGIVDHATGTKDIRHLGGLARAMPVTAIATVLAALSMAGLPPMIGFIGKELLYEAKLHAPFLGNVFTGLGLTANIVVVAVSAMLVVRTFFGARPAGLEEAHDPGLRMVLGPAVLTILSLLIGIFPEEFANRIVAPAVSVLRAEPTEVQLTLWHGFSPILLLSIVTLGAGLLVFGLHRPLQRLHDVLRPDLFPGPLWIYTRAVDGLVPFARSVVRLTQPARLRAHVLTLLVAVGAGTVFLLASDFPGAPLGGREVPGSTELVITAVMCVAAVFAAVTRFRLAAVVALGVVGYSIAILYAVYSAPDLALTQLAMETLSVILFVFVLYRLPRLTRRSTEAARVRDAVLALAGGAVVTVTLLLVHSEPALMRPLADYFAASSFPLANGRNVVNVILVDFRALDTLGEITVLAAAAVGVVALVRLRAKRSDP